VTITNGFTCMVGSTVTVHSDTATTTIRNDRRQSTDFIYGCNDSTSTRKVTWIANQTHT